MIAAALEAYRSRLDLRTFALVWIEAEPGNALTEVWAYLSPDEARELMLALQYWAEEEPADPDWHHHITDDGRELTIAVRQDAV